MLATSDAYDGLEGQLGTGDEAISSRVQAVAIGGAPCHFDWIDEDSRTLNFWLGASRRQNPEIWAQATPATWLTADDPPAYFFHGTRDWLVPPSCAECFYEQVQALGIETELRRYDQGHFGLFSNLDALDPAIEFFRRQLHDDLEMPGE